jgi:hypothetical protein
MNFLNKRIICGMEEKSKPTYTFGDEKENANVIIRSSDNSQTLYIDGTGDSGWPIYIGITKSRGSQDNKLPIEPNDIIGGLQVYARIKEGKELGYAHLETPLTGSAIFKVGDNIKSSEFLIALKENDDLSVKLVLDPKGNLRVSGNIELGNLTITDEIIDPIENIPMKYIKVIHDGMQYAIPLYSIR